MPALHFHDERVDLTSYPTPVRAYTLSCNNGVIYEEHLVLFDRETGECLGEDPGTRAAAVLALARALGVCPASARECLDTVAHYLDTSPLPLAPRAY